MAKGGAATDDGVISTGVRSKPRPQNSFSERRSGGSFVFAADSLSAVVYLCIMCSIKDSILFFD